MITGKVEQRSGTLYYADGACAGAVEFNRGRALLGSSFWVPERTCTMEDCDQDGYLVPESLFGDGFCSECWGLLSVDDKYCCHCGAKVVD